MSTPQPGVHVLGPRWVSTFAALLIALSAVTCLVAILVALSNPDTTPSGAPSSLVMAAVINAGLAAAAYFGQRNRGVLIAVALGVVLVGLFILDGIASLSNYPSAPQVLAMLFWGALSADALAAGIAVVAAIFVPRRAG